MTLRAKQLDDWCTDFLQRHPDAVVLHLGCGLDGRVFRLDPPPSVLWFDVDQACLTDGPHVEVDHPGTWTHFSCEQHADGLWYLYLSN